MVAAKNKWAKSVQRSVVNFAMETDSCAAIDGARMSKADREKMRKLLLEVGELLSKY